MLSSFQSHIEAANKVKHPWAAITVHTPLLSCRMYPAVLSRERWISHGRPHQLISIKDSSWLYVTSVLSPLSFPLCADRSGAHFTVMVQLWSQHEYVSTLVKVWGESTYPLPNLNGANRWSLGMDKQFHLTLNWTCEYLSMLVNLKLIYVSKGARGSIGHTRDWQVHLNVVPLTWRSYWVASADVVIAKLCHTIDCFQN